MSKRQSTGGGAKAGGGGNTLFNYFTKSPSSAAAGGGVVTSPKPKTEINVQPKKLKLQEDKPKEPENTMNESEEEEEDIIPAVPRRKRIRLPSQDSETEENNKSDEENIDQNNISLKLESSFKFQGKSTPTSSPASKKIKKPKLNESLNDSNVSLNESKILAPLGEDNNWLHCRLDFLKPDQIQDGQRRKPNHVDYDPTTLYVPDKFRKEQTPAHRQWWEMKSKYYDCVLFFKVGKFYELYHMDASVGVNELGFSYMKGDFAHSGFPESAYARMAATLVQKGYKVARVEQTETPDMMQERTKKQNLSVKEKVVMREICQITCKGTEICGLQDSGPPGATPSYMLALAEEDIGGGKSRYGVCFIDTSIGVFHIGQFDDDKHSSRLLTLFAHYPPALVLTERGVASSRTAKALNIGCQGAKKEVLQSQKQFWSANQTLKTLAEKYYQSESGTRWPETIKPMLSESDSLGLTPDPKYALAIKSLGACLFYLTNCLLDIQIMEMSHYTEYIPPDTGIDISKIKKANNFPSNMILDAITLHNLRIVGEDSSLISKLDQCTTAMGKRLLRQWVCSPSCNVEVIKERQQAISSLINDQGLVQDVRAVFNKLPDMERLLTKIHTLGNFNRSKNHPDSRAILYEMKTYSKRKVIDFISLLNGFKSAADIMQKFANTDSSLLQRLSQNSPSGVYPEYSETLKFFNDAFDHSLAEKEGTILPEKGVDPEYDNLLKEADDIKEELEEYRQEQERRFNCKVSYFGSDKKRYQLEIPESKCNKANRDYQLESSRKGFKRFSTSETKEFLARMTATEAQTQNVLKDLSRRVFEKFSQSHSLWQKAIECISVIDVLISLTEYARLQSGNICIPKFVDVADDEKAFISIQDGRHPCIPCSDDFIPNDTHLSAEGSAPVILLTGPNMGGKSTLMRQVGLLTVMAQIGCHVPCSDCSLSIVDRIFTRLGAHDDIMAGQSTFLVELSETAAILKHATKHSLVLLDELGRGTSTYDGTAIAAAVLNDISSRGCRTMFSTHYHTLVDDFKDNRHVSLAHMACMVETDEHINDERENVSQETVTFLYKLSPGACPKSYGFNAARLAGISKKITLRAHQVSVQMERETELINLFKILCTKDSRNDIKQTLVNCKKLLSV